MTNIIAVYDYQGTISKAAEIMCPVIYDSNQTKMALKAYLPIGNDCMESAKSAAFWLQMSLVAVLHKIIIIWVHTRTVICAGMKEGK